MMKSSDSGLWSGEINSTSSGFYVVKVKSVDGAGNITERDLNSILFVDKGKILTQGGVRAVDNAKITVYKEDEQSKVWSVWDGASFGQNNPQVTNVDGGYSYFLPNGTYYLTVTASDFKKVTSSIFKIDRPTAINMDFDMNAQSKINFGAWSFALPDFTFKTVDMVIHEPKINSNVQKENPLVEHEIPDFILPKTSGGDLNSLELRGKPQIIIFINSWLPETSSQINEIANLPDGYKQKISLILIEDSLSKAVVFSKRGGYDKLTIVSDSDGSLITPFKLNILPTSYFLDKKGIVKKVVNGTILKDDIINYIDSI
jgi:peroxiredoxin